jgi:hypothetical protein
MLKTRLIAGDVVIAGGCYGVVLDSRGPLPLIARFVPHAEEREMLTLSVTTADPESLTHVRRDGHVLCLYYVQEEDRS